MPSRPSMNGTWQEVCARKWAEREARVPESYRIPPEVMPNLNVRNVINLAATILSDRALGITDKDASVLVLDIAEGRYTSEEVARAFCHRATIAQQLTNWYASLQD